METLASKVIVAQHGIIRCTLNSVPPLLDSLLHPNKKGTVAIFATVPFYEVLPTFNYVSYYFNAMTSLRNFLKLTVVQFRIETAF